MTQSSWQIWYLRESITNYLDSSEEEAPKEFKAEIADEDWVKRQFKAEIADRDWAERQFMAEIADGGRAEQQERDNLLLSI